jgi:DNA mismatch endonuclease Vsr
LVKKGKTNSGSFKKGHRQSKESREKISLSKKGKKLSVETKNKMSESKKGKTNSGSFKKGHIPWIKGKKGVMPEPHNKGKKASLETRKKMSESKKGHIPWIKGKKGVMPEPHNKGKKASLETRKKMSESHKGKTPVNKGRKMSEGQKKKISTSKKGVKYAPGRFSGMKGKKQTEATRKKISDKNKGRVVLETTKVKLRKFNTGKKASEETKKKQSLARMGVEPWNKGQTGVYSEESLEKIRKARATQVFPKQDTKPEKYLQSLLQDKKIKFETHRNFVKRGIHIYGQPDIFIEPNICIFMDGDYWHCNPHDYVYKKRLQPGFKPNDIITGKKYAKDKWASDKNVNNKLKEKNYVVLRFWQSELEANPEKYIQKILKLIKNA